MLLTRNRDHYGKGLGVDYKKINNLKDVKASVFSLLLRPYIAGLLSNIQYSPINTLITASTDNAIYVNNILCILFLIVV